LHFFFFSSDSLRIAKYLWLGFGNPNLRYRDIIVNNEDVRAIESALVDNDIDHKSIGLVNSRILIRFNDSQSQLSSKALLKQSLSRNYVVALNLAPSIPKWLSNIGGKAMSLGLDLRGGVHFLLEVDMDAVIATSIDRYENELRSLLKKDRLYRKILKENNS
jgi:preprotein translocase subunit SecD